VLLKDKSEAGSLSWLHEKKCDTVWCVVTSTGGEMVSWREMGGDDDNWIDINFTE
jgi:hypothetical protein